MRDDKHFLNSIGEPMDERRFEHLNAVSLIEVRKIR